MVTSSCSDWPVSKISPFALHIKSIWPMSSFTIHLSSQLRSSFRHTFAALKSFLASGIRFYRSRIFALTRKGRKFGRRNRILSFLLKGQKILSNKLKNDVFDKEDGISEEEIKLPDSNVTKSGRTIFSFCSFGKYFVDRSDPFPLEIKYLFFSWRWFFIFSEDFFIYCNGFPYLS